MRYVALLRGVNLGGKRKLPMADLRTLLGGLGLTDVRTHLNSGNAVFTADTEASVLEEMITAAIAAEREMHVPCVVRTGEELRTVVAENPFEGIATDGSRLMAHFLSAAPAPEPLAAHPLREIDPTAELGDRVVYQWCPDGLMEAPAIGPFVEKHLGVLFTTRNWNTVSRLAELVAG